MSDLYPIRQADPSRQREFASVVHSAFNSTWPLDEILALDQIVAEPERTLAAFDGDQVVGTALAYSFTMTVPGGRVPTAGVSGVSVLPSHRRRGILTALIRRQLAGLGERGEPVAALFASEGAIYGRFGYGAAAAAQGFTIRRGAALTADALTAGARAAGARAAGRRPEPAGEGTAGAGRTQAHGARPSASESPRTPGHLALRLAEPADATADLATVYDAVLAGRPGMMSRSPAWWQVTLADPEFARNGRSPARCVIAADDDGPRGYAVYSARPRWDDDGLAEHSLLVRELFATDPAACAALWSDLVTRDLVGEVQASMRPVDDPLPYLLADPRQVRSRISDGLWVRIADVPAALAARRYAAPVDVVIEVSDPLLPANEGRWRLRAGGPADPAAPSCERTGAPADLTLPVSALGAAYLGGTRLGALAAAGLVREERPGAVVGLSAAMWWDPAPWSPLMF